MLKGECSESINREENPLEIHSFYFVLEKIVKNKTFVIRILLSGPYILLERSTMSNKSFRFFAYFLFIYLCCHFFNKGYYSKWPLAAMQALAAFSRKNSFSIVVKFLDMICI